MTTTEERLRILKMIEEETITAEEGAGLLSAVTESVSKKKSARGDAKPPRWFRVRVTDLQSGKSKVNVNIPMGLVDVGMKMGARFVPDVEGLDFAEMAEAISQGVQGKILDVEDTEDGERVEIYVE